MPVKVFLTENDSNYLVNNDDIVYGTSGIEGINIAYGVSGITVDSNTEKVTLGGASYDYLFKQTGNVLNIYLSDGITLVVFMVIDQLSQVKFSDTGFLDVLIENGVLTIDGIAVVDNVITSIFSAPPTEAPTEAP